MSWRTTSLGTHGLQQLSWITSCWRFAAGLKKKNTGSWMISSPFWLKIALHIHVVSVVSWCYLVFFLHASRQPIISGVLSWHSKQLHAYWLMRWTPNVKSGIKKMCFWYPVVVCSGVSVSYEKRKGNIFVIRQDLLTKNALGFCRVWNLLNSKPHPVLVFPPQEWGRAVSSCDLQTTHFQVCGSISAAAASFRDFVLWCRR